MSYYPDRCWANRTFENENCPISAMTSNDCAGGLECEHRTSAEMQQCKGPVDTEIGLCSPCWSRIIANFDDFQPESVKV